MDTACIHNQMILKYTYMYKQSNMSTITSKKSECERAFLIWITSFVRLDIFLNVKNVSMSTSVKRQLHVDTQQYKYNLTE